MTNILFYVHYNKFDKLADHVIHQLEAMRPIYQEIYLISNSKLSQADLEKLSNKGLYNHFLQRDNIGYDFSAWSDGIAAYGYDRLNEINNLTLMNDTCFGPFWDFKPTFDKFSNNKTVDFWGITNNRAHTVRPENSHSVLLADHIQSYFITFKHQVIVDKSFQEFFGNIEQLDDVVQVIIRYETAMTTHFEAAGFKSDVLFDTRKVPWDNMLTHDFSVFNLPTLIQKKIPFLKVKAFMTWSTHPQTPLLVNKLLQTSNYPFTLVANHMSVYDYPDRPYLISYKVLDMPKLENIEVSSMRIGIHLHAFYTDLVQEFVDNFDQFVGEYDLYLTTDTSEKKQQLEAMAFPRVKQIVSGFTKGRDVLPWMSLSETLSDYDVVGHFHTKKSLDNDWIVGESWRNDITDMLIKPAQAIFSEFASHPELGIFINDVPTTFNFNYGPSYIGERELMPFKEKLWGQLNAKNTIGLQESSTTIMSYGTMIWYRPKALADLLALDITNDVPVEPLPYTSILHAFERLLVYVSWANGYDYRISKNESLTNGFVSNVAQNNMLRIEAVNVLEKDKGLYSRLGKKRSLKLLLSMPKYTFRSFKYLTKYTLLSIKSRLRR
ncbi:lipopolysaccharide biosynthesis protein [Lactococcus piscium]|uniref:rhamnan synthesis F family protein n=1 Tax=Pseudolactococcus carnosus TaxID=2749961 RepID=UPI001FB8B5C0|nr:rhamnan synthesis F family protein [Lactococcus carnosus]MCJ1996253.1 lipopolysaccharide biosynthesis protein [Lactococcus carnosus]